MPTFHYEKKALKKKGADGKMVDLPYAKISLAGSAAEKEVVSLMADRTAISKGDISAVITNLGEVLATLLQMERSVKIPGIGIFTPAIDTPTGQSLNVEKARIKVNFRLDGAMEEAVNRDLHIVERK